MTTIDLIGFAIIWFMVGVLSVLFIIELFFVGKITKRTTTSRVLGEYRKGKEKS